MKLHASLSEDLAAWAQRQPVFFTASAATHGRHINVSPKGMTDTHFAVLGPNQCAYIDRTGSGCETISHAYENGRLCLMFMSFGNTPRILRFFCHARVVEWDQPAFPDLVRTVAKGKREAFEGARAVILCDIWEVQTSCGYGVPRVKKGHGGDDKLDELAVFEARPTMDSWAATKAQSNTLHAYQGLNNSKSIDGLPGLRSARRDTGQTLWVGDARARVRRILAAPEAVATGFALAVGLYLLMAGLKVLLLSPL
ncbi:pyridoxamine 5'-phosphate oxidase family protein ustO [Hirsutella rhossiliensis]|uniref:Pyridoxamine 5'-phosphate oxidase family protein ustO n=1 Tax=Hirsutella rhossiliensis TaxID=111463 RepID=A0A9P8SN76_9HYPO|nr:pyridoxamine 5'-phosphate oxidase family protein ustO [Hirsutella rhossiliensis]KAH0966891.1 pyridoxamine 5'-phosphate oxidase family protein ustO [Hirsutella rhossiliensis]